MPALDGGLSCDWLAPFRVGIALTLAVHRRGPGDPTFRVDASGALWRTSLTPAGPATLRLTSSDGGRGQPGTYIQATAWGEGARWILARVPDLVGAKDDPAAFRPDHPRLRELVRQHPGLRVGRTDRVLEAVVPAVLEQKVLGVEAHRAWRSLLRRHGLPAPGPAPAGMRVFPPAATWRAIPSWDWHRAGVEAVRARTIAGAAAVAGRLEATAGMAGAEADRLLQSLPGIGPWTAAEVRQRACGDADAVSVGDYHLPSFVSWVLAGEPDADDERMLELLASYPGQRYRVTRLIELGGGGPPRRGPRLALRDYRAF
ncbi:MAG TPA: DNA-3-methyladenine glycosylase 2 family protein [Streptosporangiaceae bacterium]|nr:DNA-3-methyladenine glycosylase 2 family protein [Streptosporangiaceae bacterium]